ncbi:MAG: two-component regulator propeller domain-containing protein [bacterium]
MNKREIKITDIFPKENKYRLDKLKVNNENFPSNIVCVIKDSRGFMWFGTQYGLYRFDGYNCKNYNYRSNDHSMLNEYIISSICDDNNYLLIGTIGNGLVRLDKITEQFKEFKFDSKDSSTISHNSITKVYRSKKNEIWIGTFEGIDLFDKKTEKFIHYKKNSDAVSGARGLDSVNTLCEDSEGYLWIGTNGKGLDRFDVSNNIFKHYEVDPKDSFSLSSDNILAIFEDSDRNIWIGTYGGGVNKFDKNKEIFYRFQNNPLDLNSIIGNAIFTISQDEERMLWFGSFQGVSIFNPTNNSFTNLENNIPNVYIEDIYWDDNGIVWICSQGEGVSIYSKRKCKFNCYRSIQENNNFSSVYSVCEDVNENLWIGSECGIDIINKKEKIISHISNPIINHIYNSTNSTNYIFKDKKNYMWIATELGTLERFEPETGRFTFFYDFDDKSLFCSCIFEDREENLWLGLYKGGIRVLDKDRKFKKKYLINENGLSEFKRIRISKIYQDIKENIWIGTNQGLAMLDPKIDKIIFYKNNPSDINSLSNNNIASIMEDKKGYLWIGTRIGLNRFDPNTKSFKHYTEDSGLASDAVNSILLDEQENLWLGMIKGLSKFNPNKETFTNYGLEEGLQGLYFNRACFKTKSGEMFFGGMNGLNNFYPNSIPQNKNIPVVVLTDFRIFNKEVKLDTSITEIKEITISYKENFFSFEYAALDYTNPEKNQHAYMLEGIDKDWNYVGNVRTANYTDIKPGEYIFRVKGSNNDGVWNEEGVSVKLIITPPWYETIWFKGLSALSIAAGLGLTIKQQVEKVKKEKKRQEEFSRKLIESQETDRKRIAAELHDSLGQDLIIIKNKALISIKKIEDSKVKEQMKEISELTSSAINEVREISYNLRPYELDRLGLLKTLQSLVDRADKSTNINFHCDIDNIDKVFAPEVEINIYRIIQECLTNIIKHSEATEVIVHLKKLEKEISIFISDNGKGFDVDKKFSDSERKGFGLRGIPERVKLFGGSFNIESELAKGTKIIIILPFKS